MWQRRPAILSSGSRVPSSEYLARSSIESSVNVLTVLSEMRSYIQNQTKRQNQ